MKRRPGGRCCGGESDNNTACKSKAKALDFFSILGGKV